MNRTLSLAAAPLVWMFSAATLLAQAGPLEVIPEGALGFAVINDLADTNQRLATVSQKMQLPLPDVLTMAKGFVGVEDGLDENGGMAIALASGPEGREWAESVFFAVVPVTDYQAFIAPLQPDDADAPITGVTIAGMEMTAGRKGNYAVLAFGEQKEALATILAAEKNITAGVAPLSSWMADKQLSLVITPAGKSLLFQSIAGAIPDSNELKNNAPGDDAELANALGGVGEMFGVFKELLLAADTQLTHLAIGIRIEDNATLRLAARALYVPDGDLAAWSKDIKVPKEGLLAGVPSGKYAIAYGGVSAHFSPAMQALFSQFTDVGMQLVGLDEEDRKELATITEQIQAGKKFSGGMMGMMRPGDSLFSTALAIEHVDDADKHFKSTRKMFELMATAENPQGDEPLYSFNEIKVGDLDALELVTAIGSLAGLGAAGNAQVENQVQGMFSKLFGTDGKISMYVAKADDHTVVTAYSREQLVHGVKHVRSGDAGLETDADIATTTALLPSGAQWVAFVSPQGLVQWASVFVDAMFGGEIKLPPFPATEPIGLAAKVTETGLDAELVLPDSVVAGIGQYIGVVAQIFQGGAPLP